MKSPLLFALVLTAIAYALRVPQLRKLIQSKMPKRTSDLATLFPGAPLLCLKAPTLTDHRGLVTFLSAPGALSSKDAGNDLPTRIKVLKWGENETVKGPVKVGPKTLAVFSANQAKAGFDTVCIDFDHQTVPGSPGYREGQPCHVAAKGCVPELVEGEGLFINLGAYTPKGLEFAPNYDDISAAVALDPETGEVIFLHSAGLTRQGAAKDIKFYSVNPLATPVETEEKTDEPAKVVTLAVDLDKLRRLLSLDPSATEADVTAAIDSALTMTDGGGAKAGDMKTLSARLDGIERDQVISAARAAGKVVPADWLPDATGKGGKPVAELRTLCAALPEGVVPLTARTPDKLQDDGKDKDGKPKLRALTAEEQHVCRLLNVKPEDYLALAN